MELIEEIVNELINEHYRYLAESERKSTETKRNIACITIKTNELQARTKIAQKYFEGQMDERKRLFESASKVLDVAISENNSELAEIAVKTIEIVHNKSPFSFGWERDIDERLF